jgi:hypothetical protein
MRLDEGKWKAALYILDNGSPRRGVCLLCNWGGGMGIEKQGDEGLLKKWEERRRKQKLQGKICNWGKLKANGV